MAAVLQHINDIFRLLLEQVHQRVDKPLLQTKDQTHCSFSSVTISRVFLSFFLRCYLETNISTHAWESLIKNWCFLLSAVLVALCPQVCNASGLTVVLLLLRRHWKLLMASELEYAVYTGGFFLSSSRSFLHRCYLKWTAISLEGHVCEILITHLETFSHSCYFSFEYTFTRM